MKFVEENSLFLLNCEIELISVLSDEMKIIFEVILDLNPIDPFSIRKYDSFCRSLVFGCIQY